jgi:hypothetical protein
VTLAATGGGDVLAVHGDLGGIALDVSLDFASAPPPIAAIARLGPELASATEKHALATVRGSVEAGGRRHDLSGALGGYDYTNGLMPRRTRWRWAFAMGRTAAGDPVGFNVTEGFVGEAECAVFTSRGVDPLGVPHFTDTGATTSIAGGGVDLRFTHAAAHAQRKNLVIVRSRFVQAVGTFRGHVGDLEIADLCGIVEDQDVVW